MEKTLVIVDFQRDFYHPDGALYVDGAEKKISNIVSAIEQADNVIFTLDWHPVNHCSFREQGGIWPRHCVSYTEGSGIPKELIILGKHTRFYLKGFLEDTEEYGAFGPDRDSCETARYFACSKEIVVCGIAAEYCVFETLKNIKEFVDHYNSIYEKPEDRITLKVFLDGVAKFNEDGTVLEDYMKENGIEEYKLPENE